jgi:hypothetical protein
MLMLLVLSAVTSVAAPEKDSQTRSIASQIHRALSAPDRRVRAVGDRVTVALREGARRSRTFARLLAALDRSDLIVYIELTYDLPPVTEGRLMLASKTGAHRYVRIQIRATLSPDEIITVIGHELQHAVEIADARTVHDEPSLRQFYERAGVGRSHGLGFDTEAARDAGYRVRYELRRST